MKSASCARRGNGPIYFAAEAKFFSLEEPITPAGNEIFVNREYYKLVGRPTLLKGYVYDTRTAQRWRHREERRTRRNRGHRSRQK